MVRWGFWLIAVAFALWLALVLAARGASGGEPTPTESGPEPTTPPPPAVDTTAKDDTIRRLQGELRVERAARAAGRRAFRRRLHGMRMTLLHQPSVGEAIELGCVTFGSCPTLWRRARCESTLNPLARNGSEASGLFQFMPSTWRSTPFGRFSIWSPYAQALAAGWMQTHGRGGEWSCR